MHTEHVTFKLTLKPHLLQKIGLLKLSWALVNEDFPKPHCVVRPKPPLSFADFKYTSVGAVSVALSCCFKGVLLISEILEVTVTPTNGKGGLSQTFRALPLSL